MTPTWLSVAAWCALIAGVASFVWLVADIYLLGYRQRMRVMETVWPITGLYAGPLAILAYLRFGRPNTQRWLVEHGRAEPPPTGWSAQVAAAVTHCGAGCTLGDVAAETAIYVLSLSVAGSTLAAEYVGDYVLAIALGLAFQYFAIAPMRGLGLGAGIVAAAKADILSLTAFEVGLFGWMALSSEVFFVSPHLAPSSPVFWFMMQIGMCLGFATAYPVNAWLIRHGVKEAM